MLCVEDIDNEYFVTVPGITPILAEAMYFCVLHPLDRKIGEIIRDLVSEGYPSLLLAQKKKQESHLSGPGIHTT